MKLRIVPLLWAACILVVSSSALAEQGLCPAGNRLVPKYGFCVPLSSLYPYNEFSQKDLALDFTKNGAAMAATCSANFIKSILVGLADTTPVASDYHALSVYADHVTDERDPGDRENYDKAATHKFLDSKVGFAGVLSVFGDFFKMGKNLIYTKHLTSADYSKVFQYIRENYSTTTTSVALYYNESSRCRVVSDSFITEFKVALKRAESFADKEKSGSAWPEPGPSPMPTWHGSAK